jgi:outer membrane receptor protein involved in Fe transport
MMSLGYQYVVEDTVSGGPQGRTFAYKGHALDVELRWLVAETVHLEAGYVYRRDDYDHRESAFGARKRRDDGHQFAVGLSYPLSDRLAWTVAYIGQRHDSNERLFEYDRHIVSTGLQLAY